MTDVPRRLRRTVRTRAGGRCEYCRMPEDLDVLGFQVDHVVARQHGGRTVPSNLAFACAPCNGSKGPNVAGVDPRTKTITPLFNLRKHRWPDHLRWRGPVLVGLTARGRATIAVLRINAEVNVQARLALIDEGSWRPGA